RGVLRLLLHVLQVAGRSLAFGLVVALQVLRCLLHVGGRGVLRLRTFVPVLVGFFGVLWHLALFRPLRLLALAIVLVLARLGEFLVLVVWFLAVERLAGDVAVLVGLGDLVARLGRLVRRPGVSILALAVLLRLLALVLARAGIRLVLVAAVA